MHLNSGIPNRAFQLAATAIGGSSWEGAGRIWYAALTGGDVGPDTDFAGFAAATVAAAGRMPTRSGGLDDVGVPGRAALGTVVGPAGAAAAGERAPGTRRLRGAGRSRGRARPRRRRPAGARGRGPGRPGRPARRSRRGARSRTAYVYDFDLCGDCATVPEQQLTDDLRRLADLLLER